MTWSWAIFIYLNAWWVSLFIMLPFGIETAGTPDGLDYAGAPKTIRWKKILLGAAVLGAFFTAIIALVIHHYRS